MSVSSVAVGLAAARFRPRQSLAAWRRNADGDRPQRHSVLALASGGLVVALAHLVQSAFAAASPTYNVWTLPTSGDPDRVRPGRPGPPGPAPRRPLAIVLLLASNLFADQPARAPGRLLRPYGLIGRSPS